MLPLEVPNGFRIIAHRGASAYAPENTLAAFRLADKMGVSELELDVQFSKDNQIVICHNNKLDCYGYPGRWVKDLTLHELLTLDIGSWFSPFFFRSERMLAFDTFLRIFQDRFTCHIEIKSLEKNLIPVLLETIQEYHSLDQVIITSFHLSSLEAVKEISPDTRIGWLLKAREFTLENIIRAERADCLQICPPAAEVDSIMVAEAHAHIPEVRTHSVRDISAILQTIETGCDGLTTNWPDWLVHMEENCKT